MSYTRSVQLPGTAYTKGAPKRPFSIIAVLSEHADRSADALALGLQISMVGGAHQRPAGHVGKAQLLGDAFELGKLLWRHVTIQCQMIATGLQILADGDHIHVMRL